MSSGGSTSRRAAVVAVAVVAALAWVARPADADIHHVPASIDATGTDDVTDALNAFVADVPDGSVISFPAGATYRVEGVLAIEGRRDLRLEFNGSAIVADTDGAAVSPHDGLHRHWPRHRAHVYVSESVGIGIMDVVVRGPNAAGGLADEAWRVELEAQHAIEVNQSAYVLVENCDVSQIFGDGVYVGRHSEQVVVRGCEIHHNGRQGIAVTGGKHVTLTDNHLHHIRRTAFDLEPNADWPVEHVRIERNRIGKGRLNFVSGKGQGSTFTGIEIVDNELYDQEMVIHMAAPSGTRRGSVLVRGNSGTGEHGSPRALVEITRFDQVTVVENTQRFDGRAGAVAMDIRQTCEFTAYGNVFTNVERQQTVTTVEGCSTDASPSTATPDGDPGEVPAVPPPLEVRIGTADVVERRR